MKVLIVNGLADAGLLQLQKIKSLQIYETKEAELRQGNFSEIDILVTRYATAVNAALLARMPRLKLIARQGIGVDNIDLAACEAREIIVFNTPDENNIAAAEHSFALLQSLIRKIPQAHQTLKAGHWVREKFMGTELHSKILGLVGFGAIAKLVAKRALAFEMKVIAYDPFDSTKSPVKRVSLSKLLKNSDFVSLHLPLTRWTKNILNAETISQMKDGSFLINAARGELVDANALSAALQNKKIAGAALDVFPIEPISASHPLLQHENLIVTPHIGAATREAQKAISLRVAREISQFVSGKTPTTALTAISGRIIDRELEKLGRETGEASLDSSPEKFFQRVKSRAPKRASSSALAAYWKGALECIRPGRVNYQNSLKLK